MLSFSATSGYAILALAHMNRHEGSWMLAKEIASGTNLPRPYLSKILNALRRSGMIRAKRGYRGGYTLARPAREISLLEVVDAIEGSAWRESCLLGVCITRAKRCCPTYDFWNVEKARIEAELRQLTLEDVGELEKSSAGERSLAI
jgi:Rrf2 family protein